MRLFNFQEVEAKGAGEATSQLTVRWLITREMGAENFAMRLFEMGPGGYSPLHSHPWEHEIFILEGEGVVVGGKKERKFTAGDVIFLPPNEKHQLKNKNGKTVKFICLIPCTQE